MNLALWVVQILLAIAFSMAGMMKASRPKEKLPENMGWAKDISQGTVTLIGVLEILGAVGLILPQITGILPWLTPVAAVGLVLTMIGAIITHMRRGEGFAPAVILLVLAAFVAFGRFVLVPIV